VYNPVDMEFPLSVIPGENHGGGKWIQARDRGGKASTLGADDGIGVAAALALLGDDSLKKYPIECLFTVQEETDMGGAQQCALEKLTGTTLLNFDAEDLKIIFFGSAGGGEAQFKKTIKRIVCPPDYTAFRVSIFGLLGGHSGVDINKGRLNAITALNEILASLNSRITQLDGSGASEGVHYYLVDFKRLDIHKANAIPAGAEAVVALPRNQMETFKKNFICQCEALKARNSFAEKQVSWSIDVVGSLQSSLDAQSTDAVLCMISQLPSGVIAMIPEVPDVVETSSNLYNITIGDSSVMIESSNRSSNEHAMKALSELQFAIGKIFTSTVNTGINGYVSWQPEKKSPVLQIASEVYRKIYGDGVTATVVHAGTECGTLAARFLAEKRIALDCISIGPTIRNPHTVNEALEIEAPDGTWAINQFYNCARGIISALFEENHSHGISAKQ
jgi:dipeptidase D